MAFVLELISTGYVERLKKHLDQHVLSKSKLKKFKLRIRSAPQLIFAQFVLNHRKSLKRFVTPKHFPRTRKLPLVHLVGHLLYLASGAKQFGAEIAEAKPTEPKESSQPLA